MLLLLLLRYQGWALWGSGLGSLRLIREVYGVFRGVSGWSS